MSARWWWSAGLPMACLCALAGAPGAAAAVPPVFSDAYGLRVVSQKQIDSRLLAISVTTAALPGPATIRILLPADYASHPDRRYPVLYLLHGTGGGAADWTTMGNAEATTAGLPLIVVMPDIGLDDDGGGWCANWWNGGAQGPPQWETFHIDELLPWIDHNLRTIASRGGRAIAGISQGGFCAMSYAARYPDLFATALSYSGAPDIANGIDADVLSTLVINEIEVIQDGVPANSIFGNRATEEINWADHDPATLAANLRDTNLYLYTGDGAPGPLDTTPVNLEGSLIEAIVGYDTEDFHNRLVALGIPSFYDDYGPGTHRWPYWSRDLQQSIGVIMADFAHPPPAPAQVTYTTADSDYSVYDWQVTMDRPATEFSTLEDASSGGFALAGSGSGSVTTPPSYQPGAPYSVTLQGERVRASLSCLADHQGRLHLRVPLGPGNPFQQDTLAASLFGTAVYTTTVTIQPAAANNATSTPLAGSSCG